MHAKKRFMERFKGRSINEFEAATMLKDSFNRSEVLGTDSKKDYIVFRWDPQLNSVLVVNDLGKIIITTYEFTKTSLLKRLLQIKDHPPVDKLQSLYRSGK